MNERQIPIMIVRLLFGVSIVAAIMFIVSHLALNPVRVSNKKNISEVDSADSKTLNPAETSHRSVAKLALSNVPVKRDDIVKALSCSSEYTRYQALAALSNDLSPGTTSFLIDRAFHDPSSLVRSIALRQLSMRKIDTVLPVIITCLSDPAPEVQETALMILVRNQQVQPVRAIIESSKATGPSYGIIRSLGLLGGDPAMEYLLKIVREYPDREAAVSHAFAMIGAPAIERITREIESCSSSADLERFTHILSFFKSEDCEDQLISLGDHPCATVRQCLMRALGGMGKEDHIDRLIEAIRIDPEQDVRLEAARSLGDIKHRSSLNALKTVGRNQPQPVQCAIRTSLDRLEQYFSKN
jgi:HEAT repeat protein